LLTACGHCFEVRWLAGCGLLLGVGAAVLWAGGMLAGDDHFDVFDEDDLPDPAASTRRRGCIGSG